MAVLLVSCDGVGWTITSLFFLFLRGTDLLVAGGTVPAVAAVVGLDLTEDDGLDPPRKRKRTCSDVALEGA